MAFEKRGYQELYQAMERDLRSRAPAITDFHEGSVVRSLFESFSVELALLYEQMDAVYRSAFVDTAEASHLDRVVAVLGITRNEPDFAAGEVTFEREPGSTEEVTIPIGTLVTTVEDARQSPQKKGYLTLEEGRLRVGSTVVDVKVQAEERGRQMTADTDAVVVLPRPVPGVKSVRNRRPIRFQGRDRESDEELRERAKKALLASGRASSTAIENALLALPGVRGVRVKEVFARATAGDAETESLDGNAPGGGVVHVYVDGLSPDNANQLRARIDEVRAAGSFVVLEPAVAVKVQLALRIEVDGRLAREEREELERQVRDTVYHHVDRLRMGEPLLFAQMTRAVLDVKGVVDVTDFRAVTFQEAGHFAGGEVRLIRAAPGSAAVAIPKQLELRTNTGQRFQVAEEAQLTEKDTEVVAKVRALRSGREGELMRTGGSVRWDLVQVDSVQLRVRNDGALRLRRETHLPDEKRLTAELEQRFVPDVVRVASEAKSLSVQIAIEVRFPSLDVQRAIATRVRALLGSGTTALPDPQTTALTLDEATRGAVKERIAASLQAGRNALDALPGTLYVDLEPELAELLAREARAYFTQRVDGDAVIEEAALRARLHSALTGWLGEAAAVKLQPLLAGRLRATTDAAVAAALAAFPEAEVRDAVRGGVERAVAARMDELQARGRQLRIEWGKASNELSAALAKAGTPAEGADPGKTKRDEMEALGRQQIELEGEQQALTRTLNEQLAQVPAAVEELKSATGAMLRERLSESALAGALAGDVAWDGHELNVKLRTVTFDGEIRADAPLIEPGFLETPSADVVFVFTRRVELAGTLNLALPLTATDEEKRLVRAAVRQLVSDYLDGLAPEENVELDRLRVLAESHDQVLRAAFEPDGSLRARVRGGTLAIGAFEKAVIADEKRFLITA